MKGTLIVSLDFELFWGMLEVCPLEDYQDNVLGGRAAIPRLLELFEKYGIHATWATVGFLFAESYEELAGYFPEQLPTYADERLLPYPWFRKIGSTEETAPCFYAPSLISQVAKAPGQEIGSHSFSHFYCREKGQIPEQFRQDMAAAKAIARDKGYDITSVVLPRNQTAPEYTRVLRELGFTAYRDEENDWCHKIPWRPLRRMMKLADVYFPLTGLGGYRPKNENGIWNLMGSRMYKPILKPLRFMERVKLHRIKAQMRHAAKNGLTFHLWWHPHNVGILTGEHLAQLEEIFVYYRQLREKYGMESLNMREAAQAEEEAWNRK
ncbi:MAG: polysaccharide deacetylase family protein [Oscillospiraceae bacterium]|nr:polysaccharide deacetylase family protein [Oscillospiraceae bacterium]